MSHYDPTNSPLSVVPVETVRQWLLAAVTAEQELAIGEKVAVASYSQGDGSRSISYTAADRLLLKARISELSAFLGIGQRRPMRVSF